MKSALLTTTVTSLERAVLLDMATAVVDGSLTYSWGHDRLALAIGKVPGSPAAKQALSVRILPSLIAKGLIRKRSDAHRGHRAEYELVVLEIGNGGVDSAFAECSPEQGMGNGCELQWVTVSDGMGNGGRYPSNKTPPTTAPVKRTASGARRPSSRQVAFIDDLRLLLGLDDLEPVSLDTREDADAFIGEYWQEVERRAHNGEAFDCAAADLSLVTRRYAREHGLLLAEPERASP